MKVYTYSEARQNFSSILDEAKDNGEVQIKRRDGSAFKVLPIRPQKSPFSRVKGVKSNITQDEIISYVRESRKPA